jgi:hypothetical protein
MSTSLLLQLGHKQMYCFRYYIAGDGDTPILLASWVGWKCYLRWIVLNKHQGPYLQYFIFLVTYECAQ